MTKMEKFLAVAADYRAAIKAVKVQEKKMVTISGDRMVTFTDERSTRCINDRYHNPKYDRLRAEVKKLEKKVAAAAIAAAKVA
jgi:hypothetical protein